MPCSSPSSGPRGRSPAPIASSSWSDGRITLDAPRDEALAWLAEHRPLYLPHAPQLVCSVRDVRFAYGDHAGARRRLARGAPGRDRRADRPERRRQDDARADRGGPARPRRRSASSTTRAAFLTQDPGRHLVTERAVDEVALGSDEPRAREALAKLGLTEHAERHPRDLSVGERERLALAAVLATEPDLLVLDEPTRGVDPERKAELAALLRSEAPRRGTLVVTHDLPWAAEVADRVVSLQAASGCPCVTSSSSRPACSSQPSQPVTVPSRRCSAAAALVTAGVAWFESGPGSTRELAVVATLGSAAAAGRVLFSALPGVQPVTVVAVVAGVALGLRAGVATGAIAAFVSNLFLGQGIWTPQQMLGWAACGAVGALLAPLLKRRIPLAVVCFVLGLLFSASMDVWLWYGFFPHTWACARRGARPRALVRPLARDRQRRARPRDRPRAAAHARPLPRAPADGGRVGVVTPFLAALVLSVSPVQFVQGHASGGAFAEPGGTGGRGADVVGGARPRGSRPARHPGSLAYLQSQEATLATPADVALVALAEESLGARPAALLDRLQRAESPNGRIGTTVNSTCWAVLALGRSSKQTTRWLLARQAKNGGLLLGGRWRAGLERHGCGARGAARRRRARCAGRRGRSPSCSASRIGTAGSS